MRTSLSGNNMICEYSVTADGFCLEDTYVVPNGMYGMNQVVKIQDYFHITYFDNKYHIAQISATKGNGIKSFEVVYNEITNVKDVWYWEDVSEEPFAIYNSRKPVMVDNVSEPQQVDVFLFCGQKNMSGIGNEKSAPEVEYGYEFRATTGPNNMYNILESFGVNENNANGINDSWADTKELRKQGSMVSTFANTYYQESGIPVVALSCSEGATAIDQWMPGTERHTDVLNRASLVKQNLQNNTSFDVRYIYFVWCQEESDGDKGTSYDIYYDSLDRLTISLVEQGVVYSCMIIQTDDNGGNSELYDTFNKRNMIYARIVSIVL